MSIWKILVILTGLFALPLSALPERLKIDADLIARIDAHVEARMQLMQIPGVALALIEDGEIVHARGFGVTIAGGPAVTEDTRFLIGSISKPLISLTLLDMVEAGLLGLDDPVVQHFPTFQTRNATRSDKMTVRHILSHRSGFTTYFGNRNHQYDAPGVDRMSTILDDARRVSLAFEPGDQFQYSNANYQLLGALIEKVADAPLEEVFAERLAAKYNLQQTQAGLSPSSETSAIGHRYWFGSPRPYRWDPARLNWAQGGIETTAADLAEILVAMIKAYEPSQPADLMAQMIAPSVQDAEASAYYGLGWFVRKQPGPTVVYHSGLNPGWEALAGFAPEDRFGFVILANAAGSFGSRNVSSLHYGVVDLILDRPVQSSEISPLARGIRLAVMALPVLILIWVAAFVFKLRRQGFEPISFGWTDIGIRLLAPSVMLGGIAYALYFAVPASNQVNFAGVALFNPDIGLALALGTAVSLLWAILRPILRLSRATR